MTTKEVIKTFFKVFLSFQLFVGNAWASQNETTPFTDSEKMKLGQYRDYLEPLGYELNVDKKTRMAYVVDKNNKKVAMEIPMESAAELKKFSPKSVNSMMLEQMRRMKAANKTAWEHSYRNLPTESAVFFIAMGAVVAGQLIADYSQNPVAMQQHLNHSLSPVGVMSFWAFMYSQGVTSNVLSMYLKNPKFHHFIPYLGMTVGSFVSSYISMIAANPNVRACAASMMGKQVTAEMKEAGVSQDPCETAYDQLVSKKTLWELAPGIVSMLASSALAGVLQSVATKTVLRLTGVDISMWLIPGSVQIKGIRLLLVKGLQITFFVALDTLIIRHVIYAWKNIFDASFINEVSDTLMTQIVDQKKKGWNGDHKATMAALKDLKQKNSDWRMTNMTQVYEAHQAWSDSLMQLTGLYNTTYSVYGAFVNALVDFRAGDVSAGTTGTTSEKLLNRTYPFYGIKGAGLREGHEDLYHTYPQMMQNAQQEKISAVVSQIDANFQSGEYTQGYLSKSEVEKIRQIRNKLASNDTNVIVAGLKDLQEQLQIALAGNGYSKSYILALSEIRQGIGLARPLMEPGRGFLATFEDAPSNAALFKGIKFPKHSGHFMVGRPVDYLTAQMLCGPDVEAKESVIEHSRGFSAKFIPPALRASEDKFSVCKSSYMPNKTVNELYNMPLASANGETYKGAIDYLKNNARSSATSSVEAFDAWWKNNTQNQMSTAFEKYESTYAEVIETLLEKLFAENNSMLNRGPLSNGVLKSVRQEIRLNQMLLGEMLKDVAAAQGNKIENSMFDSRQEPSLSYTKDQTSQTTLPLLKLFENNNILEFDRLAQPFTNGADLQKVKKSPFGYRLKAQSDIETAFVNIENLLKEIKVEENNGKFRVRSKVPNQAFEEKLNALQIEVTKLANLLGVGEDESAKRVELNESQKETALLALENLRSLGMELMMFGNIANSVSWDHLHAGGKAHGQQRELDEKVQQKLEGMKSGRLTPGAL